MPKYEHTPDQSPDDDDYGLSIKGQMHDAQENTHGQQEPSRQERDVVATTDDIADLSTSPLHIQRRTKQLAKLKPGLLDSDDNSTAEAPIAPVEDR
jgi:hypothetical protein